MKRRWPQMSFFLVQCALFSLQLFIWIFYHAKISIVTVPLTFGFVCFSLWLWFRSEH